MSNEAPESPEPEPIEDRIARVIERTLEPFVVSLLAASIAPSQCAQGIDREGEDHRWRAIETGRMLLHESRTRLKDAYDWMERHTKELEEQKQQQIPSPAEDRLYLDMNLGDDSFRRYLREQSVSRKIQDRDVIAHYRALVKSGLGGLLIADKAADGNLFGYWIRKSVADDYLKLQRRKASDATARSRDKTTTKKRKNARPAKNR